MGLFNSTDIQYLRRFWYDVFCSAHGLVLNNLTSEKGTGEYYVAYEKAGKRYITPFDSVSNQRNFATSLKQDPSITNIKLALIGQVSAKSLIDEIISRRIT